LAVSRGSRHSLSTRQLVAADDAAHQAPSKMVMPANTKLTQAESVGKLLQIDGAPIVRTYCGRWK
jgi:hypothetical protein